MGKDKSKKKQGVALEKSLRKQTHKQHKQLIQQYNEQPIDQIILQQQSVHSTNHTNPVNITECESVPTSRSNASLAYYHTRNEFILFGGELYNGSTTECYNELYIYNISKNQWKLISCHNQPTPRSSHQSCIVGDLMYMFGGEYTSTSGEQFHHFNELYTLDLLTYTWNKMDTKSTCSARSGHRMIYDQHNNRLIVFGGFFDNNQTIKYYNDLHMFDITTQQWNEYKYDKLASVPCMRSGFCFISNHTQNTAYMYGGITIQQKQHKLPDQRKKSRSLAHNDTINNKQIILNDMWSLDLMTLRWSNIKKVGLYPCIRSGISCSVIQNKQWMVLFGGVADTDSVNRHSVNDSDNEDEDNETECYNDLYVYDMVNKQFFIVNVAGVISYPDPHAIKVMQQKKLKSDKQKLNSNNTNDANIESTSESIFDFDPVNDILANNTTVANTTLSTPTNTTPQQSHCIPYARRSAMLCSTGNELYIYGGVLEISDCDVTLNDMYSIDITGKQQYHCINECNVQELRQQWKDDDDSQIDQSDSESYENDSMDDSIDDDDDSDTDTIIPLAEYFNVHRDRFIAAAKKLIKLELESDDINMNDKQSNKKFIKQRAFELCTDEYNKLSGKSTQ